MGLFSGILQGMGGLLGAVVGGNSNAKAVDKATAAQIAGIREGIAEQRRQFDLTRGDMMPWMETGQTALGDLGDLLGMNGPEAASAAIAALKNSPVFQTLYDSGEEALLQTASATGGLRGGNTQRGLADFGADTLSQVIESQMGRLGGLSGAGLNAAGTIGGFGANMANNVSSGMASIGNSRANGVLGRQQAFNNMGSQISQILSQFIPGAGGF